MRRPGSRRLSILMWVAFAPGCASPGPTGPVLDDADLRVLFIGNSLTYENDLPGLVETIAEVAGRSIETATLARANYGLGDHWVAGASSIIRDLRPDVVVLQQGPSTLPSSRTYLREWTDSLARVIHEVGADPALLMVWPPEDPRYTFMAVHDSYRLAAEDVGGVFIPAGMAWLEAWQADEALPLYAGDRFHPAPLGSIVAAMTVVRTLFDESLMGLPAAMIPTGADRPRITLTADLAQTLFAAVERAVEGYAILR